jgi:CHAT domain-containing protein
VTIKPRQNLAVAAAFVPAIVLAACQTGGGGPPSVSLEEAKQITGEFGGSFTPPPKSINDLLTLIDKRRSESRVCDGDPTLSDYEVRNLMAHSATFGKSTSYGASVAVHQAEIQFQRGSNPRAIKYMKWAINADDRRSSQAGRYAQLAIYHAHSGNLSAAEKAMSESQSRMARLRPGEWGEKSAAWFYFHVNEGRAAVAELRGDLVQGEAYHRLAIEKGRMYTGSGSHDMARAALARNLMRQGRLMDAENTIRDSVRYRLSVRTDSPELATGFAALSEILYEQGRYNDAEALARITVDLYRAMCVPPGNLPLAIAQDVLAKSLVGQERWEDALAVYKAISADMAKDTQSFQTLSAANLYRGLALLHTGRTAEANETLRLALERTRNRLGDKHYKTAELYGFLAMTRLAEGNLEQALDEFAAATEILVKRSREADDENTTFAARDRRLNLIVGGYIGLLADIRGTALARDAGIDSVSEAFRLAETARSRSVQRALSASGARAALNNSELVELARREQDTQKQIAALYGNLAKAISLARDQQDRDFINDLKVTIDQLRGARAALMEEIEARFPEYAILVNPQPPTLDAVRSALHPGEALVSTYTSEGRSYVWAVPKNGAVSFAAVPLGRAEVGRRVDLLRRALDPNARTLGEIPEFDLAAAHDLYKELLKPVEAGWRKANTLLVVAHGALGSLPLAVLPTAPAALAPNAEPLFSGYTDVPWLARSHAVTVLPSVASLVAQRALPAGDPTRRAFAGFADPWFSEVQAGEVTMSKRQAAEALTGRGLLATRGLPVTLRNLPKMDAFDSAELEKLPRLPDTAEEVRSIALAMNADLTRDVFVGKAANEAQVKNMDLFGYRVIAFATHGLVPGDLNGLTQPALALSAPDVAGVAGDGLLTMGEILGLKLDADWVVLSACNTAAAQGAGAEAISGLGRAFFYAGARALLVSNWPVETTSAKLLTTDIFRQQARTPSLSRAGALRQAMLNLVDGPGYVDGKGRTVFSYAHPIFWAPFSLIGDGGGSAPGA